MVRTSAISACMLGFAVLVTAIPFQGQRREQSEFGTCSYDDQTGRDKDECSNYYHVGDTSGGGTLDVDCHSDGKCYVSKCVNGWNPDANKRNCVAPDKSLNYCSNGKVLTNEGCGCPSGWKLTNDGTGCWKEQPATVTGGGNPGGGFCQFNCD